MPLSLLIRARSFLNLWSKQNIGFLPILLCSITCYIWLRYSKVYSQNKSGRNITVKTSSRTEWNWFVLCLGGSDKFDFYSSNIYKTVRIKWHQNRLHFPIPTRMCVISSTLIVKNVTTLYWMMKLQRQICVWSWLSSLQCILKFDSSGVMNELVMIIHYYLITYPCFTFNWI